MNIVLDRLKEIVSSVMYAAEGADLETVLERIAQVSRELLNARYAALGIPGDDGGLRYFKFAGMSEEEIRKMAHLPRGEGLLGAIMKERRPIRLNNIADDPRSAGFPAHHPAMTSFLGVPIQVGQQLLGMLYLTDRLDGKPFDDSDQWLLETMAGYTALAIAGAELNDSKSRTRLLEERERIGMELHDGIIQSLYAVGMHLDLIRVDGNIQPDDLQPIINNLNHIIEDIRRYILQLRAKDHVMTVKGCFTSILKRLHVPDDVEIAVDAPEKEPPFTPATFESICLMVNEAVSNAVRHADASQIRLNVAQDDGWFCIEIKDNGRGFNPHEMVNHSGLGLRNMQQRARLFGGTVEIDTEIGAGTVLTINIPIRLY